VRVVRVFSAFVGVAFAFALANVARADWWSENFELHGKATSNVYFNSPSLSKDFQMDQWMNSVELNFDIKLYEDNDTALSFHSIITPTYDLVYDLYPKYFGDRRAQAQPGTNNHQDVTLGMNGHQFKGRGAYINGGFADVNGDTADLFNGEQHNPEMPFNNIIFFGALTAPTRPQSSTQPNAGGNSTVQKFDYAKKFYQNLGLTPATNVFLESLSLASKSKGTNIHSFGNPGGYVIGNKGSLEQQSFAGINHTENQLKTRCMDGVHDWCWGREAYFEFKYGDTQLRIGRQQIVWGKTDAFRLQDIVNPIDFSSHNVYPSLEDRRIPSLALDLTQSFGSVGPFEDFSLELVWVVDKFKPVQVGQCGDFWAFTAACEARADAGGHGLLNQSAAKVDEREWSWGNTEPGFRFEFRIPDPSIAFSLSGFWGMSDSPVAKFANHYSTTNPNPAMMLFLQAVGIPGTILPAFDPYDKASVQASSDVALATWGALFGAGGALCDTAALGQQAAAKCITKSGLQALGWTWSASQAVLEYRRTFTAGGSLDYQIPNIDTVLRLETAYDFNRAIENTDKSDGIDHSDVLLAAIGLDRSFFIPWLNKDRTAFVSFQTFIEHVMDYHGNGEHGMVIPGNSIISTFFIENYWRSDSIVLTNFVAYDWAAKAWITGPKLKWVMNDKISFEVGVNLLQGSNHEQNIRNICKNGKLNCLGDPTTWQTGNWQLINYQFKRETDAPWWNQESFADKMMESRDEVWAGVTYQF